MSRREDKKSWTKYSTEELINLSNALSAGLLNLGLKKGEKIAFVSSTNRPEWHITDAATLQIGMVNVPVYPTISSSEYLYILKHAEVKYLFVSDRRIYKKIAPLLTELKEIREVFSFDEVDGIRNWKELLPDFYDVAKVRETANQITADDLATIIYTSGTTGEPKGVMLTHKNIMSNVLDALQMVPIQNGERVFSFLPLCHVFERILNYAYMYAGAPVYFADGLETIARQLPDIKPRYFAAVPRILEKIYEGALIKAKKLSFFKKKFFYWSVKNAAQTPLDGSATIFQKIKLWISFKLVLHKWKVALGGEVKAIISGSAPLSPYLCRVFTNSGVNILEGYGLTETSPVLTVNPLIKNKIKDGTVGLKLPSVEIKIAKDGEILVKGPNVMQGYYKNEKETKASFTEDGWLKTGDIGLFTKDNYLKITDRKKELLKTSGGKYVAPAPIENKLKESPYIEQIIVVGDGEKFVSALIVPDFGRLKEWCTENDISETNIEKIVELREVNKMFLDIVKNLNVHFSKVEQIKKVALLDKEWTVEGGELTPTLKVKRKVINEKYKEKIRNFYN